MDKHNVRESWSVWTPGLTPPTNDTAFLDPPCLDSLSMEITSFVIQGRDQALLDGDYSTYQSQLARRLLKARKKLGIATRNRGKFSIKAKITPDEVAGNNGCAAPDRGLQGAESQWSLANPPAIVMSTSPCSPASTHGPRR